MNGAERRRWLRRASCVKCHRVVPSGCLEQYPYRSQLKKNGGSQTSRVNITLYSHWEALGGISQNFLQLTPIHKTTLDDTSIPWL